MRRITHHANTNAVLAQLVRCFLPSKQRMEAHSLYLDVVERARMPVFYTEGGVPDTLDGRFELILLFLFLELERLKREGTSDAFQRELVEVFFEDMDRSVRELGVGDTGVGRRVKKMADAFYGRMQAYESAMKDDALLAAALRRNLYGTTTPDDAGVTFMVTAIRQRRIGLK